jgi:acyl carrier protein
VTDNVTRTRSDVESEVRGLLERIAPGVDLQSVPRGADLRGELDLDSMDFLSFVVGLDERLGVEIPEEDYPQMTTLDGAVDYLLSRLSPGH